MGAGEVLRRSVARCAATLVLAAGGLLLVGGAPALADAAHGSVPVPSVPAGPSEPYGGALDNPEDSSLWSDERVLEVSMLVLGTLNGLAFAGAMIVSRFRGSSASETRRALMSRTDRGVASERRQDARGRARAGRSGHAAGRDRRLSAQAQGAVPAGRPVVATPVGGPGTPAPRVPGDLLESAAPMAVSVRPATPRR